MCLCVYVCACMLVCVWLVYLLVIYRFMKLPIATVCCLYLFASSMFVFLLHISTVVYPSILRLLFLSTCFFMNMIMSYQPVWGGFVGWGKPLTQVDHKQHKFFFVWVLVLFFSWNIQENFSYNKLCHNKNYKSKILCKISQAEVSPKH